MHVCECEDCQNKENEVPAHHMLNVLMERLNEQQKRWVGGLLSTLHGHGGDVLFSQITGLHRHTLRRGREELADELEGFEPDRIRRPGAGRPADKKKTKNSKQNS